MGQNYQLSEHNTGEQIRLSKFAARALAESWTAARLAREADVGHTTASKFLSGIREKVIKEREKVIAESQHELVIEAQKAKRAAITHLEQLRELSKLALEHAMNAAPKDGANGRPVKLDEFGQPVPFDPKEFATTVKTCVSATRDLKKFADEVTGVDVVKAITIKTHSDPQGKMVSWSGVDSLSNAIEAEIIKDVEALPLLEASPAPTWEF